MRGSTAFAILVVFFAISCKPAAAPVSISDRPASVNDVRVKKPLREMTWNAPDGKQTSLGDLTGEAVILDFWATYCPPCKDEIPHLNELHAKYGDSGLRVIGLNSGGPEDRPKIASFLSKTPIHYDLAFPEDSLVGYVFDGDDRIPQTLVIDRKGQIVKKIVGYNDQIRRELDEAVQSALNSQ